ncbi:ATP-binding protein [Patescibacteria group bacterium]|nr:ATP-binding protein [Patescibacteria group bacterium]
MELTTITDPKVALTFDNGEYENNWWVRLAKYRATPEYQQTLKELEKELSADLARPTKSHKYLILFMGLPGSGKSTIAEEIKKFIPCVILRSDWIYFKRLREELEGDYYKAYCYVEDLARTFSKKGYTVILDENSRTKILRNHYYEVAAECKATPIFINISVDFETALDREILKGGEKKVREVRVRALKNFAAQMEPPIKEERKKVTVINVDGNQPISKIMPDIKRKLS